MGALFLEAFFDLRRPTLGEDLQGRDIQVAVVEERLQGRHVTAEKAPVLADAVAANWRLALGHPLFEEGDGLRLGLGRTDLAVAHALGQAALAVGAGVPLIHTGQQRIALMHGDDRTGGENIQVAVGDDGRHLDDDVMLGF